MSAGAVLLTTRLCLSTLSSISFFAAPLKRGSGHCDRQSVSSFVSARPFGGRYVCFGSPLDRQGTVVVTDSTGFTAEFAVFQPQKRIHFAVHFDRCFVVLGPKRRRELREDGRDVRRGGDRAGDRLRLDERGDREDAERGDETNRAIHVETPCR